jgi:hypothetical protein
MIFYPPEPGRLWWGEDTPPHLYRDNYWSPFESAAYAQHQLKVMYSHVEVAINYLSGFDRLCYEAGGVPPEYVSLAVTVEVADLLDGPVRPDGAGGAAAADAGAVHKPNVFATHDGVSALEESIRWTPRLVVMDLPRSPGIATRESLRVLTRSAPGIVMGSGDRGLRLAKPPAPPSRCESPSTSRMWSPPPDLYCERQRGALLRRPAHRAGGGPRPWRPDRSG